jgi:RNA polymerase sigma-70 factor (ECF subfamily)
VGSDQADIAALVVRARDGDEQAISRLITIHKGLIYTIVIRMVTNADTARDLTHDAFVRAFRKLRDLRTPGNFQPWLCAIARRIVFDHFRTEKRKRTVSLEEIGDISAGPDLAAVRRRMIIQDALSRLNPRDRLLLVLAYYQGFSHREVAQALKIPESNVRVYIQRARDRLRKLLKGREHELLS